MAKRPKSSPSIDSTSFPSSPVIPTSSSSRMRTRPTSAGSDKLKTTMTNTESKSHTMLPAFLSKTFEIFSMPEFSSICGWNTSGDTIIVSQLESFVALVLPRFFKHRNFPSFVRQLNLYGFHKTVLDSKRLEFQHAYFKRDRPDLLPLIKRKVSTPSSSTAMTTSNSSSATNSRLELHRELSDQLLKEIKELRQKGDAMEKRLREVEVDNAIVRSDNIKLWKHLESAKDKQLMMQEKMKKIMWILYQIYRGKQVIPKLGQEEDESRLAPNEFRDVLRFLAMDEPPMLAQSSTADKSNARKRKFVEVASLDESGYNSIGRSVVDVTNPLLCQKTSPELPPIGTESNVLSIFNPMSIPRSMDTISLPPTTSEPNDPISVPPGTPDLYLNPTSPITSVTTFGASGGSEVGEGVEEDASSAEGTLDFIDDALPLLDDTEQYPFTAQQEQHVMQKLEDFESSLLDEYDVGCLDTLMQQLRNTNTDKTSLERSSFDREEIVPNGLDDVLQGSL